MNQDRKKKLKAGRYLIIMSVILSVLFLALLLYDAYNCLVRNLNAKCSQKEEYLKVVIDNGNYQADVLGKSVEEGIIDFVEREYPTSASDFCFLAVDGKLVYLRDKNTSKGLNEISVDEYFNLSEGGVKMQTEGNTVRVLINGGRYYISRHDVDTGSGMITVGICASESYLIGESGFDTLMQHTILYMALFSVAFVVSIIFLAHRDKENAQMEKKLSEQLVENRRLIERLGEQIEAQSEVDYQRETGFCTKKTVEKVFERLNDKQRKKSCLIHIYMEEENPAMLVRCSVLLERLKINKSICCLWEDDEFLIVLLNTEETGAHNFVKHFLLQYQRMFQSDAKGIRITISKC